MPSDPAQTAALITLLRTGKRPWAEYVERVEEAGSATEVLVEDAASSSPDTTRRRRRHRAAGKPTAFACSPSLTRTTREPPRGPRPSAPDLRRGRAATAGRQVDRGHRGAKTEPLAALQIASGIARHLTTEGFTVVSGLASGIDSAAHRARARRRRRTIAVIGTGTGHAYPPENAGLQDEIDARGAVVSQFWPDAGPTRASFPLRNAVMSGLSLATVIVEASATSGTRTQARAALEHGRPVFLLDRRSPVARQALGARARRQPRDARREPAARDRRDRGPRLPYVTEPLVG